MNPFTTMSLLRVSIIFRKGLLLNSAFNQQHIARSYYVKASEKASTESNYQSVSILCGVLLALIGGTIFYLGMEDEDSQYLNQFQSTDKTSANPVIAHLQRAKNTVSGFFKSYSDPTTTQLIPDRHPEQPKYTLVIELRDLLVKNVFNINYGWKFQKRPGVHAFLNELFSKYELVLYTREHAMVGDSLVNGIDQFGMISYRIYRPDTKYLDGEHVKDLSCLNRDLSKVIVLDTTPGGYKLHPNNGLTIAAWDGDIGDRTLLDLITFLTTISDLDIPDVREVVSYYNKMGPKFLEEFLLRKSLLDRQKQEELDRIRAQNNHKIRLKI